MKRGFTLIELMAVVFFMLSTAFLFTKINLKIFNEKKLENIVLILNTNIRKANIIAKDGNEIKISYNFIEKYMEITNDNIKEKIYLDKNFEYETKSKIENNRKIYLANFNDKGILNKSFSIIIKNKKGKILKNISYLNTSYKKGLIIHVK